MKSASLWVVVLGLGVSALASAQPGPASGDRAGPPSSDPPGAGMVPPSMAQPTPPADAIAIERPHGDQGVVDDAMSPGAFVSPTALTEPHGTITLSIGGGADDGFNNSELTNISASFAITDELTIGGSLLIPTEDFRLGMISAKYQVLRSGRLRLAAQGNVIFNGNDAIGIVGGVATYCLDDGCNSTASGDLGVGIVEGGGSSIPFVVSGSIVYQVVPHVKLVGEVLSGFVTSDVSGVGDAFLGFYGVRFTRKELGVNIGFAKVFGDLSTDGPGELFASITGRVI